LSGEAVKGAELDCFIELTETHSILFSGREVRGLRGRFAAD
jgi:hypothetical protein